MEYMFYDQIELVKTAVLDDEEYEDEIMINKMTKRIWKSDAQKVEDDRRSLSRYIHSKEKLLQAAKEHMVIIIVGKLDP